MDARTLIDTTAAIGLPAPFWFLRLLKVVGFTLHAVPMNLWYAGVLLAMLLYLGGGEHGRRFARRLMTQMPVILAYGINFGIVPLLFVQVAIGKVFYPATILMAWFWLAIIAALTLAYYGVYITAFGWRKDRTGAGASPAAVLSSPRLIAGCCAAILFIAIGFTFANGFSLTTNVKDWPALWQSHELAGAALGTALNTADPTFWPRWLMMFGLALTTTAAWVIVDVGFFARHEPQQYQRWAQRLALVLYTLGLVWFAVAGSWYVFGTWRGDVFQVMFHWPWVILTGVTALAPGLPWLLIVAVRRRDEALVDRRLAALVAAAQFGVLGLNALSRQIVQELELGLGDYFHMADQPVQTQWNPLAAFVILAVLGGLVVAWMIAQILKAPGNAARPDETV